MTRQELIDKRKELGLTVEMVAERSGVPLGTAQKIFAGITKTPRYDTLLALEYVLTQEELRRQYIEQEHLPANYFDDPNNMPPMVRETQAAEALVYNWETYASSSGPVSEVAAKKQGTYTIEDYYALPDDRRVELIDGVIYDMGAPTVKHQKVLGFVFSKLMAESLSHDGKCQVFVAPIDVRLFQDDKNMFQPDALIICSEDGDDDERLSDDRRIEGAPDFVLEVLSPTTRKRDLYLKNAKYMEAGVREYWIIDPQKETLTVYDLEMVLAPVTCFFDREVPVRISDGAFGIDLRELHAYLHPERK